MESTKKIAPTHQCSLVTQAFRTRTNSILYTFHNYLLKKPSWFGDTLSQYVMPLIWEMQFLTAGTEQDAMIIKFKEFTAQWV